MKIIYSRPFLRAYKKLPKEVRIMAEEKEGLFKEDPFYQCLRTHKLHGRMRGFYSFSIDFSYRIIFSFLSNDEAAFHDIGTHDIYD